MRELENIRNFLTSSALTLVIDLRLHLRLPGRDVLLLRDADLVVVAVASRSMSVLSICRSRRCFRPGVDEKFQRGAENQAFLVESVTGVQTLKAMAVEPQMQRRWEEQLAGYVGASFGSCQLGNAASQLVQSDQQADDGG